MAVPFIDGHGIRFSSLDNHWNPSIAKRDVSTRVGFQGYSSIRSKAWSLAAPKVLSSLFYVADDCSAVSFASRLGIVFFQGEPFGMFSSHQRIFSPTLIGRILLI